jgi:hypothetical protein
MPQSRDLPDDLKPLVRRNALQLSHDRFRTDSDRLASAVERALEKTAVEQREREEPERLSAERRETELKERFEAERRQEEKRDRLETEQPEKERLEHEPQSQLPSAVAPATFQSRTLTVSDPFRSSHEIEPRNQYT